MTSTRAYIFKMPTKLSTTEPNELKPVGTTWRGPFASKGEWEVRLD